MEVLLLKSDVFISYRFCEFDYAEQICSKLEAEGYSCWLAPKSIPGGSSYANEIEDAIRNSKVVVLVLSEKAMDSIFIPKELSRALAHGKKIIPFHIDRSKLKDPFTFYLTDAQRIEAADDYVAACDLLLSCVVSHIGLPYVEVDDSVFELTKSISSELADIECEDTDISTNPFDKCNMYITGDSGSVSFFSKKSKSMDNCIKGVLSDAVFDGLANKIIKVLSLIHRVDEDEISITFSKSDNRVALLPMSERTHGPWLYDDCNKIRFEIQRFDSTEELLYDSIHFDLASELKISFFYMGGYLPKTDDREYEFSELGIDVDEAYEAMKDLIEYCNPCYKIKVQKAFIPIFYNDGSGSYHLRFISKEK